MPDHTPIPEPTLRDIYAVLVRLAGARPDDVESFVMGHADGMCREYRFQGTLGADRWFRNDGFPWRVTCYRENETPESWAMIVATNAALRHLWFAEGSRLMERGSEP